MEVVGKDECERENGPNSNGSTSRKKCSTARKRGGRRERIRVDRIEQPMDPA